MRSPRLWYFSRPTTAATSRERNCLWMAASHKCRPFIAEGQGIKDCASAPHFPVPSAWNVPERMFRTKGVVYAAVATHSLRRTLGLRGEHHAVDTNEAMGGRG